MESGSCGIAFLDVSPGPAGHESADMDYDAWIERERRIRTNLLMASPLVDGRRTYRVCQDCFELCLCHEETCPNCNAENIVQETLAEHQLRLEQHIRCRSRFARLEGSDGEKI